MKLNEYIEILKSYPQDLEVMKESNHSSYLSFADKPFVSIVEVDENDFYTRPGALCSEDIKKSFQAVIVD